MDRPLQTYGICMYVYDKAPSSVIMSGQVRTYEKLTRGTRDVLKDWRYSSSHRHSIYRHAHGNMIIVFKYLHGAYSVGQCPLIFDKNRRTLGHSLRQKKSWCASTSSKLFTHRITDAWVDSQMLWLQPQLYKQFQASTRHSLDNAGSISSVL